jgi:hypothetical protein
MVAVMEVKMLQVWKRTLSERQQGTESQRRKAKGQVLNATSKSQDLFIE